MQQLTILKTITNIMFNFWNNNNYEIIRKITCVKNIQVNKVCLELTWYLIRKKIKFFSCMQCYICFCWIVEDNYFIIFIVKKVRRKIRIKIKIKTT